VEEAPPLGYSSKAFLCKTLLEYLQLFVPYRDTLLENIDPKMSIMNNYQPCPKCGSQHAEPITFTWWGGLLGPKLFTHVACTSCRTTFNGKTGQSNQGAIIAYVSVSSIIGIIVLIFVRQTLNSNQGASGRTLSPNTIAAMDGQIKALQLGHFRSLPNQS
jgi:predicted nucleic-acid-binding Zn-ribbon protein